MLLKHRQDGFGGEGNLCMHVVMHSVGILTDGSGKTASTLKIVSDVVSTSICRWKRCDEVGIRRKRGQDCLRPATYFADGPINVEAAGWRPHRES
jgi:hypothetical protein